MSGENGDPNITVVCDDHFLNDAPSGASFKGLLMRKETFVLFAGFPKGGQFKQEWNE